MFNVDPSELMLLALVALVVIGPKDLPKAMRFVGQWVGKARGVMGQFRAGFDTMVREAELKEMEERWAAENARIMREYPAVPDQPTLSSVMLDGEGEPAMTEQPVLHHPAPPALTDEEIAAAEGVPLAAATPPSATP
ncbi:MAG: twin arginine-targeting protein translocase TatB [Sphingomonas sp. 28-62-20]|uniref:Sec-independent protein translocase protein TatB n=1 Tax=Sphingomonas sp. 28-62-20 TaxID=1970433 RepID=UPI000BDD8CD3|nr:MAG: twin arginine-targeting protein translocase TatB [Sphingomonas sp. 28-62-20]